MLRRLQGTISGGWLACRDCHKGGGTELAAKEENEEKAQGSPDTEPNTEPIAQTANISTESNSRRMFLTEISAVPVHQQGCMEIAPWLGSY